MLLIFFDVTALISNIWSCEPLHVFIFALYLLLKSSNELTDRHLPLVVALLDSFLRSTLLLL
ncbi:hypothetical protein ECANGB1_2721 [Enterospora canceri]|uniref:Uncharacterized protein n=1 Tax=Enterospora canceri TaxID=1081671 RepID=A0A1Y1S4Y8_9MICR|nr:hypothetical protein ECANGB1_2721 [Enterospora canceri]